MFDKSLALLFLSLLITCWAGAASAGPAYDAARAAIEAKNLPALAAAVATSDPDELHNDQTPLLSLAASRGDLPAADWLLSHGADPDVRAEALYGGTPLMLAAGNNDVQMLERLLAGKAAVDARDKAGDTALNWAAYYGFTEAAAVLIRNGTDMSLRGHGNALEIALRRGHQPFIIQVLEAQHRLRDLRPAERALQSAIEADDGPAVLRAVRGGADPNGLDRTNRPWVSQAARLGRTGALSALLRAGARADRIDQIGFTALMEAAREGEVGAMRQLIEAGARVDRRSNTHGLGVTALHLAAIGGDQASVTLLLDHGANIDALDVGLNTPMIWALYESKPQAAALLVRRGGNPDLTNDQGDNPRAFAIQNEVTAVVAALTGR